MGLVPWLLGLVIGISTNLDYLGVGLAGGHKAKPSAMPLWFCLLTAALSSVLFIIGGLTSARIAPSLTSARSQTIGACILVCIGLWIIAQAFLSTTSAPPNEATGFSEWMFILVAELSADVAIGLGVGFTGFDILPTAIALAICSFTLLIIPARLRSHLYMYRFSRRAMMVSGILLILIGFWQ